MKEKIIDVICSCAAAFVLAYGAAFGVIAAASHAGVTVVIGYKSVEKSE